MKIAKILALMMVLFSYERSALALDLGALLIDVSASMQTQRSDGTTRCEASFQAAEKALKDFFDRAGGSRLKIYSFSSGGALQAQSADYLDRDRALQVLSAMPKDCSGSATALAESICTVVADLRSSAGAQAEVGLFLMTDGKENDSRSCHKATAFQPQDVIKREWHRAVFDQVMEKEVRLAALIFWPQAGEIPDDFEFLKYLSLVSGSEFGGALSASHGSGPVIARPTIKPGKGHPFGIGHTLESSQSAFSVIADDMDLDSVSMQYW